MKYLNLKFIDKCQAMLSGSLLISYVNATYNITNIIATNTMSIH